MSRAASPFESGDEAAVQQALENARRRQQRVAPNATPARTREPQQGMTPPASLASTTEVTPGTVPRSRMPKRSDQATPLPDSTPVLTPGPKHVKMLDPDGDCKRTLFESGGAISAPTSIASSSEAGEPWTSSASECGSHGHAKQLQGSAGAGSKDVTDVDELTKVGSTCSLAQAMGMFKALQANPNFMDLLSHANLTSRPGSSGASEASGASAPAPDTPASTATMMKGESTTSLEAAVQKLSLAPMEVDVGLAATQMDDYLESAYGKSHRCSPDRGCRSPVSEKGDGSKPDHECPRVTKKVLGMVMDSSTPVENHADAMKPESSVVPELPKNPSKDAMMPKSSVVPVENKVPEDPAKDAMMPESSVVPVENKVPVNTSKDAMMPESSAPVENKVPEDPTKDAMKPESSAPLENKVPENPTKDAMKAESSAPLENKVPENPTKDAMKPKLESSAVPMELEDPTKDAMKPELESSAVPMEIKLEDPTKDAMPASSVHNKMPVQSEFTAQRADDIRAALRRPNTVDFPINSATMTHQPGVPKVHVLIKVNGISQPALLNMTAQQVADAGLVVLNDNVKDELERPKLEGEVERPKLEGEVEPPKLEVKAAEVEGPKEGEVERPKEGEVELKRPKEEDATSKKKRQHALYMKFSRSVKSPACPPEVQRKHAEIVRSNDRKGRTLLFEQFLECSGDWMQSSLVINHRNYLKSTRKGIYKYMSFATLLEKYSNDWDAATEIAETKEKEGLWIFNPDKQDQKLYYCWDSTEECREEGAENSMSLSASAGISSGHYNELMLNQKNLGVTDPGLSTNVPDFGPEPSSGSGDKGKGKGKGKKGDAKGKGASNKGKGKDGADEEVPLPKVKKTALQEAKGAMNTAAACVLECKSWAKDLKGSNTPVHLMNAVLDDLVKYVTKLEDARGDVEAAIAHGKPEDELRMSTGVLASVVSDYRTAAKHAKKLKSGSAKAEPKSKAKAKAK